MSTMKHPQQIKFLNATFVGDQTSPGIGTDGVYRDPWGNPYIITLDLNGDQRARDLFYGSTIVSTGGLNGLILTRDAKYYEANSRIMVWSAGPDKAIDPGKAANVGANKDNVLSWSAP